MNYNMDKYIDLVKEDTSTPQENNKRCAECKGRCCKSSGCELHPEDLKTVSAESIIQLCTTGIISIDCWEGDVRDDDLYRKALQLYPELKSKNLKNIPQHLPRTYYIRMRNDDSFDIVDFSWGGICVLYSEEKGCSLEWKHRPRYGRIGYCDDYEVNSKFLSAIAWLPYQNIFTKLIKRRLV